MDTEVLKEIDEKSCKPCGHWQDPPGKCSSDGPCPKGVSRPQQETAEMD